MRQSSAIPAPSERVAFGDKWRFSRRYLAPGAASKRIALWNTRYLDAAVTELRSQGKQVRDEDIARLSPLGHAHLNELGRYSFSTANTPRILRPFRDPTADAETT